MWCTWPIPTTTPCAPSTWRLARSPPWQAPASRRSGRLARALRAPRRSTRPGTWCTPTASYTSPWRAATNSGGATWPVARCGRSRATGARACATAPASMPGSPSPPGSRWPASCSTSPTARRAASAAWSVGRRLFEFGDVDGVGDAVRLQHPIGLAVDGEALIVADTYNHKLKRLGPRTRACTTWAGSGEPGHRDGPLATAQFWEPSGVSVAGDVVYVADTNNHAVRVVDRAAGVVRTLELRV